MNKANNEHLMTMGYAAVVVTSFLLGLFPTVSKPIVFIVSPLFFTAICALAPFAIFTPLSVRNSGKERAKKVQPAQVPQIHQRRIYGIVLLSSFVGGIVGPLAYFYGLQSTTAADASLLANAEMVFTILIASMFFHEKLNRVGLVAVILVAIGVVIVATNLQFSSTALDLTAPGHLLI
ncbi:MAG TPA: DMT family transporter, partial [Nitrososphaerales archaeon]|nr:DMT family transporter [Nitrososphaerales archaeon]